MTESTRILEPRALRAAVPEGSSPQVHAGLAGDDAQRLHAWTSTAHAAELPGHLTASRPSPDASNRHIHDSAPQIIQQCIERARRTTGLRGWQAERSAADALAKTGDARIAAMCAAAARRLGESLR